MNKGFPKVRRSHFSGNAGINIVSQIINDELNWIIRTNNNETDFGIDAHVDVVLDNGCVTGQSIALQIKSGPSYFEHESPNGWTFYGDLKHLNYYANTAYPVLIIICDIENKKCYWQQFDVNRIETTVKNWKINIPASNVLNAGSKSTFIQILPKVKDYLSEVQEQNAIDDVLKSTDLVLYAIARENIENRNIEYIKQFFERLQRNDNLYRSMQGRVEIMVSGYDDDLRELFEIKEVKKWFKKANMKIKPWFFFLNTQLPAHGFLLFWQINCDVNVVCDTPRMTGNEIIHHLNSFGNWPQMQLTFNKSSFEQFFNTNWPRLNEITHRLGISLEENKRISKNIMAVLENCKHKK